MSEVSIRELRNHGGDVVDRVDVFLDGPHRDMEPFRAEEVEMFRVGHGNPVGCVGCGVSSDQSLGLTKLVDSVCVSSSD